MGERPGSSVVNIDDEWGARLVNELRSDGKRVVTYSQGNPAAAATDPDFLAEDVAVSLIHGTSFLMKTPQGDRRIRSPLVGRPHVYNMLTASAAASELGYSLDAIVEGLANCVGAPGRFERVPHGGDFAIIVDYAHTDDALLNTLRTAKDLAKGRIITVFGCGGDRDRTKRGPMGRIAGEYSDLVLITSDNPRTEDPLKIIAEIEVGARPTGTEFYSISDRRQAIFRAVAAAKAGDVVIIAGKGHETYQIIGNDKFHFDDREVALEALKEQEDD